MKNFYTLLTFMVACTFALAQPTYYVLPAIGIGQNPGNLNEDGEYPLGGGLPAGWNTVLAGTTTDQWSTSQTIPFSFMFNGSPVTSYQVSNTGVLTFNSTPGTAPSTANTALPSLAIPNMSICVWGLDISGVGSDNVVSKTFGTAPNRQHWVLYSSASGAGLPANGWTYWSIVLEETTNKIYVVDQRTGNGTVGLTVGLQVDATNYAEVSGSPAVSNNAGTDPTPADNSYYEFINATPPNDDMAGIASDMPGVVQTSKPTYISGLFRNVGVNTVNSADFNYRINGGTVVTQVATGNLPATSGEFKTVSSPSQWTPAADGQYEVEMWLSNINGGTDPNMGNDTIKVSIAATSNPPERKVVIEERTGTWCGWCPRGMVAMQEMVTSYHDKAVLIAVHNADPMALPAYDPNLSGAFPSFTGDRAFSGLSIAASGSNMKSFTDDRREIIPGMTVEITDVNYNAGTGAISVNVKSEFIIDKTGADYRYVLVLTEDGVKNSSAGYAQVNYYSNNTGQPTLVDLRGFNYTTAPDPVPGSQMIYDHVAIDISPSFTGSPGVVPSNIQFGDVVTTTLTTTAPAFMMNANHVYVNVMLVDMTKGGEVANANWKKMTNAVDLDETDLVKAAVYPNPASDFFTVELEERADFDLELINSVGQVVYRQSYTDREGAYVNTSNLAKGMYILNITSGNKISTINVAVTK